MSHQARFQFIVTAEHASRSVPPECENLLDDLIEKTDTHRIFDPGTKTIAEEIASRLKCPLILGTCTRLAVDLNRSIGNPSQFSPPIFDSDEMLKEQLLRNYFIPFRSETKSVIESFLESSQTVVHISVHSFTKNFDGEQRAVDLGILFDDTRSSETALCHPWLNALQTLIPELSVIANKPYHGREDGHTSALRKRYPENRYLGIELEFSQDLDLDLDAETYAKIIASTLLKLLARS